MKGQWVHKSDTAFGGYDAVINVDERRRHYEGVAYIHGAPTLAAFFRTADKASDFFFRTGLIVPIDPDNGLTTTWQQIRSRFPQVNAIPTYADVAGQRLDEELPLVWKTDLGEEASSTFHLQIATGPSELTAETKSWASYKQYVAELEPSKFLFRGQNEPWRLRTSFHRSGRADVGRFITQDVPALHRHLSARTKHIFNLQNPLENGAFFNLVQHHGYPTPLLDWTYSPYVAAFFAYRGIADDEATARGPDATVRVLVFDQAEWRESFPQSLMLAPAMLHVSIGEFTAIENERMIPQQAASTVTNVDDIEAYIRSAERRAGKTYLSAIDLPLSERNRVMRELAYMGITAGALFPGLDGACEDLRDRNFELY